MTAFCRTLNLTDYIRYKNIMCPLALSHSPDLKLHDASAATRFRARPMPESTSDALANELIDIIENNRLTTVFQPIIDLVSGEVYAYEALCRILGETRFASIESLFQTARKMNLTVLLEECCRKTAMAAAGKMETRLPIALNVCPSVFMTMDKDKNTPCVLEELMAVKDRIILELTERYYIQNYDKLFETIEIYRKNGFKIALDDLGAGFTRLKLLSRIKPAIIKIDRFLIADIHKSTQKQMLLESVVSFCRKIGTLVVAEGIETENELHTVMKTKVDLAQGYYLCPPLPNFSGCFAEVATDIREIHQEMMMPLAKTEIGDAIGSRLTPVPTIEATAIVENAITRFQEEADTTALPVVDNQRPLGIIQKDKLFYKLGQPHGYALFSKKPVTKIMETALVFEYHTLLEEVAQKVLQRDEKSVYDAVIVVKNGAYAGIVKIYQLLSGITEQKIQLAMQANPLTGLPGNNLIRREINLRLYQNHIFAVLYVDLDNFKPFNDAFGFSVGDQLLGFLAKTLKASINRWDEGEGFLGHVGGDDFVLVCRAGQVACLCETIIREFDDGIKQFHDNATFERGYYISRDRKGRPDHYPLLSVSIAALTTENRRFNSYGHLVSVASEIKKKVKSMPGSSYLIDRRAE